MMQPAPTTAGRPRLDSPRQETMTTADGSRSGPKWAHRTHFEEASSSSSSSSSALPLGAGGRKDIEESGDSAPTTALKEGAHAELEPMDPNRNGKDAIPSRLPDGRVRVRSPGETLLCRAACPLCAVLLHQGCDNPCDALMAFQLQCLYTVLCWKPEVYYRHRGGYEGGRYVGADGEQLGASTTEDEVDGDRRKRAHPRGGPY